MNYSDTFATAKASLLQEFRRKRPWQTYVVALGLTLCFFLVVGNVLGESSTEPAKTEIAETQTEKAAETVKVEGYQLADKEAPTSTWETTTGMESPAAAEQTVSEDVVVGPEAPAVETALDEDPSEPLGDEEAASALAESFYTALNDGNLGEAYDKLSPDFQTSLPFQRFRNGYEVVETISCEVKHSEVLPDDQVRLDLQIDATEAGYSSTYYATCLVSKDDKDDWTISGVAQLAALDY